ncbi:MAG: NADH-quinone oxidoreductase subunit L [Rhodospirillales bacterium]|nr:NADH-quinone oxidoreductase subunit L [Rhodospirillales bacterium]
MDAAVVFLPLIGAIVAGLFGRSLGNRGAQAVTCTSMVLSCLFALILFTRVPLGGEEPWVTPLFTWFESGRFQLSWALKVDSLSVVMMMVVTVVSTVVHFYSIGYMSRDKSVSRFMSYLSLFTFFMLMLVTSDNLVQMFFGWEGVGLASYLLIGFWYEKPSANNAAMKAFLVNRVGDVGFALGIAGVFFLFGAVDFANIFPHAEAEAAKTITIFGVTAPALEILCILLFVGAVGKSAQLGLHTWLPDAMEGPTPVSALIHAATMVTAGVFMVCRLSPLFEEAYVAREIVTYVGAITCFFAATVGISQNDIKRVIAYSTCSQLGYMFFAVGVSAYSAAMFHLTTHAFFKALLFLGAGCVIHSMHHDQDMRRMGGLYKKIPVTYAYMWIGSLALAGIGLPLGLIGLWDIGFAGFYSKDMVIEAAYAAHTGQGLFAYWMGVVAAVLTGLYSGRLIFMTFHGKPAIPEAYEQAHESPRAMILPLIVLAFGACFAGMLGYYFFVGDGRADFWGGALVSKKETVEHAHHVAAWVKMMPFFAGPLGFAIAWVAYRAQPDLAGAIAARFRPIYLFLLNKWYFDELYDRIFVRPAVALGRSLWIFGDQRTIDAFGPDGIAASTLVLARRATALQSGYIYHYAFSMLIGVVAFVTWYWVF